MARFVFHVEGHPHNHEMELPDIAAAKCEAIRYAATLVCDEAEQFWDAADFRLTVTDDKKLILLTLIIAGWEAAAIRAVR